LETSPSVIVRRGEWRADSHHRLAGDEVFALTQLGVIEGDLLPLHNLHVELDDRQVRPVIVADRLGGNALLVGERDARFPPRDRPRGSCENVPVIVDDHARADAAAQIALAFEYVSAATSMRTTAGKIFAVTATTFCGVAAGNGSAAVAWWMAHSDGGRLSGRCRRWVPSRAVGTQWVGKYCRNRQKQGAMHRRRINNLIKPLAFG